MSESPPQYDVPNPETIPGTPVNHCYVDAIPHTWRFGYAGPFCLRCGWNPSKPTNPFEQHQPVIFASTCDRCGRRDGLDVMLPDTLWAIVSDRHDGTRYGRLCLWCVDRIASERGIKYGATLYFAGLAGEASSQSTGDAERFDAIIMRMNDADQFIGLALAMLRAHDVVLHDLEQQCNSACRPICQAYRKYDQALFSKMCGCE